MKKFFALLAIASLFAVACDEKPTPEDKAKTFNVTPTGDVNVAADATSIAINVEADITWTVECDNAAFSASPASGNGNASITVNFPANESAESVTAVVKVVPEKVSGVKNAGIKTVTINIIQAGKEPDVPVGPEGPAAKVLAEWEFTMDYADFFKAHFTFEAAKGDDKKPTPESNAQGFLREDHYCPSNKTEGGRIRFWNGTDKTAVNPDGRCKRGMGNAAEPCWYGNWIGDVVYINAATEPLPAGTKLHLVCPLRPNTNNTLKYWLVEILDGDKFVALGDVKTVNINGIDVKYNVELVYDNDGVGDTSFDGEGNTVYPENPKQYNTIIDETYTLTAPVSDVEYHITCQSLMMADGSREATDIGDVSTGKRANPVLRFAGKDTTNGGCTPAGVNMLIEIVE